MTVTDLRLAKQVALVTGASRGIGEAVARRLAEAGASVWLLARRKERLEELAVELGAHALPADVTDEAAVVEAVDRLVAEEGHAPDLLVNAAGTFDLALIPDTEVEILDRHLAVNVRGAFLVIRSVLPGMLKRGRGRIVNVGSVAGRRGFPENGAYSASKFGLRGVHEVLLAEIRGTGVTATLLEPGAVDTTLWDPVAPDEDPGLPDRAEMLRPEDVAEAVRFLATRPERVQVPLLQIERS